MCWEIICPSCFKFLSLLGLVVVFFFLVCCLASHLINYSAKQMQKLLKKAADKWNSLPEHIISVPKSDLWMETSFSLYGMSQTCLCNCAKGHRKLVKGILKVEFRSVQYTDHHSLSKQMSYFTQPKCWYLNYRQA